jgi:hypothetical protein
MGTLERGRGAASLIQDAAPHIAVPTRQQAAVLTPVLAVT